MLKGQRRQKAMICQICPRKCNALRDENGNAGGRCKAGILPRVARAGLHYFEEPFISGKNGSGTVFFSGCSLSCVYCQNELISQKSYGKDISVARLAEIFRELTESGAHNINLVTPTHFSYAIKEALDIYRPPIPVIYNTGGYELASVIRSLENYIDVYLFDLKYLNRESAYKYSGAADYPEYAVSAIREAYRQKSECVFENGMIKTGVVIRHLLLPAATNEAIDIFDFVHKNTPGAYFSIMSQYIPLGKAKTMPPINRKVTEREYDKVLDHIIDSGFNNCFFQEKSSADTCFIPNFDLSGV